MDPALVYLWTAPGRSLPVDCHMMLAGYGFDVTFAECGLPYCYHRLGFGYVSFVFTGSGLMFFALIYTGFMFSSLTNF